MDEASTTTSDPWVEVNIITRGTTYNLIKTEMDHEKIYTAGNAFTFGYLCDILTIDRTQSIWGPRLQKELFSCLW